LKNKAIRFYSKEIKRIKVDPEETTEISETTMFAGKAGKVSCLALTLNHNCIISII